MKGDLACIVSCANFSFTFTTSLTVLCLMTFVSDLFLFHNAGYILVHFQLYVIPLHERELDRGQDVIFLGLIKFQHNHYTLPIFSC